MKQHITQKQWNELIPEKMAEFFIVFNREYIEEEWFKYWRCETVKRKVFKFRPNIGQMIEFLGDNWFQQSLDQIKRCIYESSEFKPVYSNYIINKQLCDVLWKAVKYKLK